MTCNEGIAMVCPHGKRSDKSDIELSTGRVVTHLPMCNGATMAVVKGDSSALLTNDEWNEYCEKLRAAVHP